MLYLLNLRKHSNQVELDQFFGEVYDQKEVHRSITKSAFFQARKQLSHTAFTELNSQLISSIYPSPSHLKTWRGFRLCAIDGTSVRLPGTPDITQHFGTHKGREGQANCTMGMASAFYDVLNHLIIDSCIHPNGTSEKSCVPQHLSHATPNDLILYDRGYPAFWLYALHLKHNISFCIRAKTNQCLTVKSFIESNQKEAIVTFQPNKPSLQKCLDNGLSTKPITLRLVRVDLPNEVEVLITNVMDSTTYEASAFKSLYHLRWGIEENYKRLKQWVEIENFSGKSALSVKQDFYAKIVAANLTSLMVIEAQAEATNQTKECRLKYQVNFAQALSKMKHQIPKLLTRSGIGLVQLIQRIINSISISREAIRKGRKASRRLRNIKNDIHFSSYKSTL